MSVHTRWFSLSLLILALTAGGCVSLPTEPGGAIGTLRVSGPNVWLNNKAGKDGDTVRIGSSLATGPGSSALVEFRDGGYLQLDEKTDPIFDWLAQSKCILIRIFTGQAYLKRQRACVEGPNISLVLNSEANIRIKAGTTLAEVTLLKGNADITAPAPKSLVPAQQITVTGKRVTSLRTLSPNELKAVVAWREKYRFKPLPTEEPESPFMFQFPQRRGPTQRTQPQQPAPPPKPAAPATPPSGTRTAPPNIYSPLKYPDAAIPPPPPVIR